MNLDFLYFQFSPLITLGFLISEVELFRFKVEAVRQHCFLALLMFLISFAMANPISGVCELTNLNFEQTTCVVKPSFGLLHVASKNHLLKL